MGAGIFGQKPEITGKTGILTDKYLSEPFLNIGFGSAVKIYPKWQCIYNNNRTFNFAEISLEFSLDMLFYTHERISRRKIYDQKNISHSLRTFPSKRISYYSITPVKRSKGMGRFLGCTK